MSDRNRALLLAMLVPAFIISGLTSPPLVTTAEGCSGGPGVLGPGWNDVRFEGSTDAVPIDRALRIVGTIVDLEPKAGLEELATVVETAAGETADGTLILLGTTSSAADGTDVHLAWRPSVELKADTDYTATVSVDAASSGSGRAETRAIAFRTSDQRHSAAALPPVRSMTLLRESDRDDLLPDATGRSSGVSESSSEQGQHGRARQVSGPGWAKKSQ